MTFDGEIPEGAAFWIFFSSPVGSMPPCSLQMQQVEFPNRFKFTGVTDTVGNLHAFLDVDGGFPPIPELEDYIDTLWHDDMDFENGMSGIAFDLHLNTDDESGTAGMLDGDETDGDQIADGDEETANVEHGSCESESGVSVSGEIRYTGDVPAGAKLWLSMKGPDDMIPPCSMEVADPMFPLAFEVADVPNESDWSLTVLLDMDGGFPPTPVAGDYVGEVPAANLDLSADVSDLTIDLVAVE